MKNLLLFLFAGTCLFACFVPPPEVRLTPLPTPPHARIVKIFFPGEALPKEPYIKIKVLSIKRNTYVPTTNLVQELVTRAQQEGADAILIFGRSVYTENSSSSSTTIDSTGIHTSSSSSSSEWHDVSAVAIKYLRDLDYLPDYVREKRLLHRENDAWRLAATGQVMYNGPTIWQPVADPWLLLWAAYDLETIMPEPARKLLHYTDGPDGRRVSKWFETDAHDRKYRFRRNADTGRIDLVEIVRRDEPYKGQPEKIIYNYDADGRLTARTIETRQWGTIQEQHYFDAAGKATSIDWRRGGKDFLKLELVYFRVEDATEFLN